MLILIINIYKFYLKEIFFLFQIVLFCIFGHVKIIILYVYTCLSLCIFNTIYVKKVIIVF